MFFYHLIDGLFLGGLYASIALGLTLVFGVMKMVNFAAVNLSLAPRTCLILWSHT